ncbi:hypothetical protein BU24DRAFT_462777 [Aaosphaeria arxii CBS 175.79]|uniref:Transcription factor domain-containing protein n=1 Tax=Aaosphaeria arxii CBS 175.79 TaxID=1450172 RepID=A0A6A5XTH2_9PLEO|nr:uncharacterized protein BU24DRAFT_462777 [Aaosphaeria arxii CBS 175.79]KAF2016645.1 hypothetical protein BU24DRAFT_462777 [Aaosphaeria arxii CBS 175.79]
MPVELEKSSASSVAMNRYAPPAMNSGSSAPKSDLGQKGAQRTALRAQLDGTAQVQASETPSLTPPSAESISFGETRQLTLELIAPMPIVHRIISDWFGWIHPVAPIFNQRQIFGRLMECETAMPDASFLILISSICAATVASLRRRRGLYGSVTVEQCLELAESLGLWSGKNPITLENSLAMYNFSSATHHELGIDAPVAYRFSAESSIGVKYLIYHELQHMSFYDQQILKRLYWLLFAGQCTSDMYGRPLLMLHHAHEQINDLIPLDVHDDEPPTSASPDHGLYAANQPRSYVPGLNALSKMFLIWQSSQTTSIQTMANLQEHIKRAQQASEALPPTLMWKSHRSSPARGDTALPANETSDFGTDVQTVNIRVTQLHIRSNLLEQMNGLARTQNLLITPSIIVEERHRVVDELLEVLEEMPHEVFDANGCSIIPKIRDIGSALLDEVRTGTQGGNLQASMNLDRLLKKLEELDV